MPKIIVTVRPNGPLVIEGDVRLQTPEGKEIGNDSTDGRCFLCRCGRSAIKPFCDGAHKRTCWNETENK
ncbi:CDGSH iron-sulfur domain-containing protein [bacterium]|nr:CDGSH iron-sulfur domain-containing protein [bacterium]